MLSVPFWIQTPTHPCTSHPCTAWNITFISMICHFRCCPRLCLHYTCRTSDDAAGLEHGRVYANVGGVTISDPDCNVTVGVMFWFVYFSVVFCIHEIYIRRRKQWCLRLTVCHFHVQNWYYSTMPRLIQFPFYGTFKLFLYFNFS